jgi:hypothetical protein
MDGITKSLWYNICNHYSPKTQLHGAKISVKLSDEDKDLGEVCCAVYLFILNHRPAIHPKVTDDCADQFNSPHSFCFQTGITILEDDGGFVDEFGSKRSLFALAHTRSALAHANNVP